MLIAIPHYFRKVIPFVELQNLAYEKESLESYCQAIIANISDEQCSMLEGRLLPSFVCTAPKEERDRLLVNEMVKRINKNIKWIKKHYGDDWLTQPYGDYIADI